MPFSSFASRHSHLPHKCISLHSSISCKQQVLPHLAQWVYGTYKGSCFRRCVFSAATAALVYCTWTARNKKCWEGIILSENKVLSDIKYLVKDELNLVFMPTFLNSVSGAVIYLLSYQQSLLMKVYVARRKAYNVDELNEVREQWAKFFRTEYLVS